MKHCNPNQPTYGLWPRPIIGQRKAIRQQLRKVQIYRKVNVNGDQQMTIILEWQLVDNHNFNSTSYRFRLSWVRKFARNYSINFMNWFCCYRLTSAPVAVYGLGHCYARPHAFEPSGQTSSTRASYQKGWEKLLKSRPIFSDLVNSG